MTHRLLVLLACLASVCACGGEDPRPRPSPPPAAPKGLLRPPPTWRGVEGLPWARVSPAQAEAAERMGAPVAFENDLGMRFVFVPEGTFAMGSPPGEAGRDDDEAQHEVRLRFGFYVQTAPLTWTQYLAWPVARLHHPPARRDAPVTGERPEDVAAFGAWLSRRDLAWDYRLPTEAEWEYAARAGSADPYPWGAELPVDASRYRTNAWGLQAMHGGVLELCQDRYGPYPEWAVVDPRGPAEGNGWVVRGARLARPDAVPARCADRSVVAFDRPRTEVGVRLVAPLGYGLGRYGAADVTFTLVPARETGGTIEDAGAYDLRVIRMNERLAARVAGIDPEWTRVPRPGSPVTLRMVPGKYYVYAETKRADRVVRGLEIKFQVWGRTVEVPVPVPEADLSRYGSGTDRPR